MELPNLGQHCSEKSCNRLDFLPLKCDACHQIFCDKHYQYSNHNCNNAYLKDNQVPVCPLCNIPIPLKFGEQADALVSAHIDNECQSDPAKDRRKVFTNKCSFKGCKVKEVIPVICNECNKNFCLKHRHTTDHNCPGVKRSSANQPRTINDGYRNDLQGNISEDEALAKALALSEQEALDSTRRQTTRNDRERCDIT